MVQDINMHGTGEKFEQMLRARLKRRHDAIRRREEGKGKSAGMGQIATRWRHSERPVRNLPNGILRKFLRGLSQFPLSSSANSRGVPAPSAKRSAICPIP